MNITVEPAITKTLQNHFKTVILDLEKDTENQDYQGLNIHIANKHIKYRKAKLTPKKRGFFVTLWKRDPENKSIPYTESDSFDMVIIAVSQDQNEGIFIFPKSILIEKNLITTAKKQGKRGFRVYPNWVVTQNRQAISTQKWQTAYFIDLHKSFEERLKVLLR